MEICEYSEGLEDILITTRWNLGISLTKRRDKETLYVNGSLFSCVDNETSNFVMNEFV